MTSFAAFIRLGLLVGAVGWTTACSDPQRPQAQQAAPPPKVAPPPASSLSANAAPAPAPASAAPASTSASSADAALRAAGLGIEQAAGPGPTSPPPKGSAYDPALVKVEVLLDRAGFSPGVIDGKPGENLQHALAAFALAHGSTSDGTLDQGLWNALASQDRAPVAQTYQITAADEAGPFIGAPPKDYRKLAMLPALSYSSPVQELAEMFHMDQALLKALNPGADFSKAGTRILVVAPRLGPRPFQAARIEVDKTNDEVRAYGDDGRLVAFYPASVGSVERPAPSGAFVVTAVSHHPAYFYDSRRLTFTPKGASGRLRIAPGPNNPVGLTWIALSIPTYGIHGSPNPAAIGKHQSHGCVRLTNWDAVELGRSVTKGVKVQFLGREQAPGRKA